jgi:hypothetical protein
MTDAVIMDPENGVLLVEQAPLGTTTLHTCECFTFADVHLNITEGEALRERIQFQVEYYLSRENLARDAYLVSQMDQVCFRSISLAFMSSRPTVDL